MLDLGLLLDLSVTALEIIIKVQASLNKPAELFEDAYASWVDDLATSPYLFSDAEPLPDGTWETIETIESRSNAFTEQSSLRMQMAAFPLYVPARHIPGDFDSYTLVFPSYSLIKSIRFCSMYQSRMTTAPNEAFIEIHTELPLYFKESPSIYHRTDKLGPFEGFLIAVSEYGYNEIIAILIHIFNCVDLLDKFMSEHRKVNRFFTEAHKNKLFYFVNKYFHEKQHGFYAQNAVVICESPKQVPVRKEVCADLSAAIVAEDVEKVAALLRAGANPNAYFSEYGVPLLELAFDTLHIADGFYFRAPLAQSPKRINIFRLLLLYGARPDFQYSDKLKKVTINKGLEKIYQLIIDEHGYTALPVIFFIEAKCASVAKSISDYSLDNEVRSFFNPEKILKQYTTTNTPVYSTPHYQQFEANDSLSEELTCSMANIEGVKLHCEFKRIIELGNELTDFWQLFNNPLNVGADKTEADSLNYFINEMTENKVPRFIFSLWLTPNKCSPYPCGAITLEIHPLSTDTVAVHLRLGFMSPRVSKDFPLIVTMLTLGPSFIIWLFSGGKLKVPSLFEAATINGISFAAIEGLRSSFLYEEETKLIPELCKAIYGEEQYSKLVRRSEATGMYYLKDSLKARDENNKQDPKMSPLTYKTLVHQRYQFYRTQDKKYVDDAMIGVISVSEENYKAVRNAFLRYLPKTESLSPYEMFLVSQGRKFLRKVQLITPPPRPLLPYEERAELPAKL